jgi:hypothetical protein
MADTQNATYGQAFSQNVMQLAQQKYSRLLPCVYQKPNVTGKVFFQDQIGQWSMEAKASRNVATPNNDPNLTRRRCDMVDYHDNRMLDRGDELRSISDPRSQYTVAAASSIGRKMDEIIITAAINSALAGETGATTVTQGNIVLATAASMTLARIIAVKQALDDADVELEDRFFVVKPGVLDNLLNLATATSADYNAVKGLISGQITEWMGFKWIMSTRIAAVSSSTLLGVAFQRFGLCAAQLQAPLVRTDERADLSYSWQVYYELNMGACRLEESRVVVLNEG